MHRGRRQPARCSAASRSFEPGNHATLYRGQLRCEAPHRRPDLMSVTLITSRRDAQCTSPLTPYTDKDRGRERAMWRLTHSSPTLCALILAATLSASAKEGDSRTCTTNLGGQVVCGDLVVGITLEQYEAGLKRRADEIRAEEAEKAPPGPEASGTDRARNHRREG
jgi:hypothetical protein